MPAAGVAALHEVLAGPLSETYGALPKIALPGDDELLLYFAKRILDLVKDQAIYRRDTVVVYPYEQRARLEPMEASAFRSWVEDYCVCYKVRYDQAGDPMHFLRTMPKDIADGVLNCVEFWQGLREIEECNSCPLPVLGGDGGMELLLDGYDAGSKTLTFKL